MWQLWSMEVIVIQCKVSRFSTVGACHLLNMRAFTNTYCKIRMASPCKTTKVMYHIHVFKVDLLVSPRSLTEKADYRTSINELPHPSSSSLLSLCSSTSSLSALLFLHLAHLWRGASPFFRSLLTLLLYFP